MDKNTVTGLLLMAAVFFGFMWLSPRKSPVETPEKEETTSTAAAPATTADALSATEKEWLVKNIIENGEPVVLPDSTHATRLNDGAISLTVAGDSVSGTVTVDGKVLDWGDIVRADMKKMSVQQQRKAIEAVRTASL